MHTSILTRTVISVASLAIGSVALAAAPASADTPAGITREAVLKVASDARFVGGPFGSELDPAAQALVEKVCGLPSSAKAQVRLDPGTDQDGVDGFLARAVVEGTEETASRTCTFAAFATSEPFSSMSGTANISAQQPDLIEFRAAAPSHDYALSGDVYVTAPVDDIGFNDFADATASGTVTRTEAARTTTSRVITPKTTARKAAARKAYQRTIDKAQAKLAKALKKAGNSSSKKAAARKTYAARKKAAKAKLHIAWSGDKKTVVTTVPTGSSTKEFTFSTGNRSF
jgi:hypothetical protein